MTDYTDGTNCNLVTLTAGDFWIVQYTAKFPGVTTIVEILGVNNQTYCAIPGISELAPPIEFYFISKVTLP